jgi:hypothetical protein
LKFVDDDGHACLAIERGFAKGDEQLGQIDFEITAVGRTGFRVDIEPELDFTPPMKLRKTRSPRFTFSLRLPMVSSANSTLRNSGASRAGSDLLSWASIYTVRKAFCFATSNIRFSNTVLPTPRSPTINRLFSNRPALTRPTVSAAWASNS